LLIFILKKAFPQGKLAWTARAVAC